MSQRLTLSTSKPFAAPFNQKDPYFSRVPDKVLERILLPLAGNPCSLRQCSLKLKNCTAIESFREQLISLMRSSTIQQRLFNILCGGPSRHNYSHIADAILRNNPIPSDERALQECRRLAIFIYRAIIPDQRERNFYHFFYLIAGSLPKNQIPKAIEESHSKSFYPICPVAKPLQKCLSIRKWLSESPEILAQIKKLDFGDRSYTFQRADDLPLEIGGCVNLETLRFVTGEATTLPESFKHLQNLQELNLFFNRFTKIPKVLFHLRSLNQVDLSHNDITELPQGNFIIHGIACPPGNFDREGQSVVIATLKRPPPWKSLTIILTGTPFARQWIKRKHPNISSL